MQNNKGRSNPSSDTVTKQNFLLSGSLGDCKGDVEQSANQCNRSNSQNKIIFLLSSGGWLSLIHFWLNGKVIQTTPILNGITHVEILDF